MSLIINNNMMAANTARNLTESYGRLATSVQRLSTGLRINSAADDAAGLAIRETMRAEIAALNQGIRNAQDGISMIQTAEGALAVIDEKLIRMKELAEQAATGTYTNEQRLIIHSEFAAMAAEIDRIAESTEFNGIKLLNGSSSSAGYSGQWSENNTWVANAADGGEGIIEEGAEGAGLWSNNSGWTEVNGEADENGDIHGGIKIHFGTTNNRYEDYYFVRIADSRTESLFRPAGMTRPGEGDGGITGGVTGQITDWSDDPEVEGSLGALLVDSDIDPSEVDSVILTEAATVGSDANLEKVGAGSSLAAGTVLAEDSVIDLSDGGSVTIGDVIFTYDDGSNVWTAVDADGNEFEFTGSVWDPTDGGTLETDNLTFNNTTGTITVASGETATLGAAHTVGAADTIADGSVIAVNSTIMIEGTDLGAEGITANVGGEIGEPGADDLDYMPNLLSQHAAQRALVQLDTAIARKENIRASLGALQNRLENTITNLSIQAENLQAAESRISDVDIAKEMTEFVRNQVLTQAAVAMLGQANSLPQMALRLLG